MSEKELAAIAAILPRNAQNEIAERLGVSQSYVSRVLSGERKSPKVETELAAYLKNLEARVKKTRKGLASVKPLD